MADAIIVKEANSPEASGRTALFLHRVEANMPEPKRRMIEQVMRHDPLSQIGRSSSSTTTQGIFLHSSVLEF